jgi:hypothetical protein
MSASLSDTLPGPPPIRRVLYAAGFVLLLRFLFSFTWLQVVVVTAIVLVGDSVELADPVPGADARHFRLLFGLVAVAAGAIAYWLQSDLGVAVGGLAVGGWLTLDALYSLRAGIRPSHDEMEEQGFGETLLLMQVGNLVADELKDGPRTVPELAAACDMTESRVREALKFHERAGTAYREGDRWVLDDSNVGLWAFVRDNGRRIVSRLLRPFRLFVPT